MFQDHFLWTSVCSIFNPLTGPFCMRTFTLCTLSTFCFNTYVLLLRSILNARLLLGEESLHIVLLVLLLGVKGPATSSTTVSSNCILTWWVPVLLAYLLLYCTFTFVASCTGLSCVFACTNTNVSGCVCDGAGGIVSEWENLNLLFTCRYWQTWPVHAEPPSFF